MWDSDLAPRGTDPVLRQRTLLGARLGVMFITMYHWRCGQSFISSSSLSFLSLSLSLSPPRAQGFLAFQHAMARTVADRAIPEDSPLKARTMELIETLVLQRLPYPKWESNYWPTVLLSAAPWFILIPLMFGAANLGKDIVLEKEHRIKAAMMMMGVRMEHHWAAWFLRGFTGFGISLFLVAGICTFYEIFPADFSVLAAFFLLAAACVVTQTFLFSSMFQKGTNAAMACGFAMYITFLPFQCKDLATLSTRNPHL